MSTDCYDLSFFISEYFLLRLYLLFVYFIEKTFLQNGEY